MDTGDQKLNKPGSLNMMELVQTTMIVCILILSIMIKLKLDSLLDTMNVQDNDVNGSVSTTQSNVSTMVHQISQENNEINRLSSESAAMNDKLHALQDTLSLINGKLSNIDLSNKPSDPSRTAAPH
jgi:septal ring factor EnvC (AmiA/AmiB activator)